MSAQENETKEEESVDTEAPETVETAEVAYYNQTKIRVRYFLLLYQKLFSIRQKIKMQLQPLFQTV